MQRSLPVEDETEKLSPTQMQEMYALFTEWKAQFQSEASAEQVAAFEQAQRDHPSD